jgi:uncharacterized tellurite resistance protein B-like protein
MLQTLKDLFDSLMPAPPSESKERSEHTLQLATAVMLVEMMRADPELAPAERNVVIAALRDQFGLAADEVDRLMELAVQASRDATDYYRFTSKINERFDLEQKVRMIEMMWKVAYADGHLDAHENHLMRKVGDLLYVPHGAYVAAKARARQASGG